MSEIARTIEQVLMTGDLSKLSPDQRVSYYNAVCQSVGLNPLTRPFEYLTLNGKLQLYARKDCTDQLRNRDDVSIVDLTREFIDGVYVVTATAKTREGRTDQSIGAVSIESLKGDAKANGMMKAETKAKRRVTLSICGLGMLDESEVESIPGVQLHDPKPAPKPIEAPNRQKIAAAVISAIDAVRSLDDLKTLWRNLPCPAHFLAIDDEHSDAIIHAKDDAKLALLKDEIDRLCGLLKFGDHELSLIAQKVNADLDSLSAEAAAAIVRELESEMEMAEAR